MKIKSLKLKIGLFLQVMLIITVNAFFISVQAQFNTNPAQTERPIYEAALKAYKDNNYKLAGELGLKSALLEGDNDLSFLTFIYSWVARLDSINDNAKEAITHLEKAISFGYGSEGEFTSLIWDPKFKILHQQSKWRKLIKASRNNFVKKVISKGNNPEIQIIFEEDQADRHWMPLLIRENPADIKQIMFAQLIADENRRKQMTFLLKSNKLKTSSDYHAASFVFQHSGEIADIRKANELAQRGYDLATEENDKCRLGWILAATTDRYLWYQGKPQIYGTQSRPSNVTLASLLQTMEELNKALKAKNINDIKLPTPSPKNTMTREPIDKTKVTDSDRKRLCVPSIYN